MQLIIDCLEVLTTIALTVVAVVNEVPSNIIYIKYIPWIAVQCQAFIGP